MAGPEYMAEYARRFVQKGATLIGGCCGTTPAMIREIKSFIRSVNPAQRPVLAPAAAKEETAEVLGEEPTPAAERSEFASRLLSGKFCILRLFSLYKRVVEIMRYENCMSRD